jgi:hypothetical protein
MEVQEVLEDDRLESDTTWWQETLDQETAALEVLDASYEPDLEVIFQTLPADDTDAVVEEEENLSDDDRLEREWDSLKDLQAHVRAVTKRRGWLIKCSRHGYKDENKLLPPSSSSTSSAAPPSTSSSASASFSASSSASVSTSASTSVSTSIQTSTATTGLDSNAPSTAASISSPVEQSSTEPPAPSSSSSKRAATYGYFKCEFYATSEQILRQFKGREHGQKPLRVSERAQRLCYEGIMQCQWKVSWGQCKGKFHLTHPQELLTKTHLGHTPEPLPTDLGGLLRSMTDVPRDAYELLGEWIKDKVPNRAMRKVRNIHTAHAG